MMGAVDIMKGREYFNIVKVLFDHPNPFLLAHGGFQIQIEQTKKALEAAGVEVEWLRWWDDQQKGDLIHHFNAASPIYLEQARGIGIPVVMTTLFTETCNRSQSALQRQGWLTQALLRLPGGEGVKNQVAWRAYNACAQNIVGLAAERQVLEIVYRVPPEKISQVPLGLSDIFLQAGRGKRIEDHLICTGTITGRKRSVELARLAHTAGVPILFVGKPYHSSDPYWREFVHLIDGKLVKHHPHVRNEEEMIKLLQAARGFVLMSRHENWCFSAHEAVACGLPLLVPDQRWSRERFGGEASYFRGQSERDVEVLRKFHGNALSARPPQVKLWSWKEAVIPLISCYARALKTS
jgi:glycosyltransferase involved in cell wall biosynthesis